MKISCELKYVKKEDPILKESPPGEYLCINTDKNTSLTLIPLSEFMNHYEESKRKFMSSISDSEFKTNDQTINITKKTNKPDFIEVINYLIKKITINNNDFNDEKNELIIESNFGNLLDLPWEKISDKNIVILRIIISEIKHESDKIEDNLLFVLSNANSYNDKKAQNIEKKSDEILYIIERIMNIPPKEFKINHFDFSKHTTKESFKKLPWKKYNYAHFIMHGEENGGLCLEHPEINKYKDADILSAKEIITFLQQERLFLLFFSCCYSGGGVNNSSNGTNDNDSIAFQIINKGIAKYSIGYRYGINDTNAASFAKIFYNNLISILYKEQQNRLERIYSKSLLDYYEKNVSAKNIEDIPILYINN
jgi:hypothetical protein